MRRLVRTNSNSLPPSADSWRSDSGPAIVSTIPVGKTLKVKTFSGVILTCVVRSVRTSRDGSVYDVTPVGDPKVKELRAAGVPVDERSASDPFVVFEWQILG